MVPVEQIARLAAYERDLAAALPNVAGVLPEHAADVAAAVCTWVNVDSTGLPYVVDHDGVRSHRRSDSVMTLIEDHRFRHPERFRQPVPSTSTAPTPDMPSPLDAHKVAVAQAKATTDARMSDTMESLLRVCGGNPYRGAGTRTAAALVEARDPARAAKLKAEAGV